MRSVDASWRPVFQSMGDELDQVERILRKMHPASAGVDDWGFTPRWPDLFRVFRETSLYRVKVIILAMDPYPGFYDDGTPLACGIAFAAYCAVPASLGNIYKELHGEDPGFRIPSHGDLTPWCRQGVLLLNTSLTHLPGTRKTQKDIWLPVVHRVLNTVCKMHRHLAICLWGRDAEDYRKHMPGNHAYFISSHPSPLSARKGDQPFLGSNHFALINEHLRQQGKEPIVWDLMPRPLEPSGPADRSAPGSTTSTTPTIPSPAAVVVGAP